MTSGKPLLNYEAAAKMLGLKLPTLYSHVCRKRIPHIRLSQRMVRYDEDELAAWLRSKSVAPKADTENAHE